ncbi:MAG: sigma-70 family RNA polymerase sigma factor [Candidatus Poribacteria bacterium]|nr:sigma-70 family RNA polymerase sigma factor [Candidatus Poribacteria bacterium]MDE0313430.1 sigma-70 family RNA polymerase sigma factor [Candidatus Poribacteria bacterium]
MENTFTTQRELSLLDEKELIKRTQKGESEAFNPLVNKYRQKIYNLIYQRVHNRETAEDICQEVFLKAWKALPNFKGQSAFYSWLYKIAINCSTDFLRKQNKQSVVSWEELPSSAEEILQTTQKHLSLNQILEKKEFEYIVDEAVRQLPTGQRRVFYLRYAEELPIKDIASRLNRSEGTIKTHLHHAHRKLRDMLRPYLQNEPIGWLRTSLTGL